MNIREAQAKLAGLLSLSPTELWVILGLVVAAFVAGAMIF
jgi:hypothetical protein